MELKYIDPEWAKPIQWIALLSYLFVALYYFAYLPKYLAIGWMEGLTYIFVAVGFALLIVSANLKLKKLEKDVSQIENSDYLFDPYSMSGWMLLTIHFIAILVLPSSVRFAYYYIIGLLGYLFLSQGYIIGTYLIVLFYVCSITYYKRPQDSNLFLHYMILLSKITIGAYMGTFAYIDYKKRTEN